MANIGDQYIITIDSKMTNRNGFLYTASGMNTLTFDDKGLAKLIPYRKTDISMLENGFRELGMEEAFAAMKVLDKVSEWDITNYFGPFTKTKEDILENYSAKEIVEFALDYVKENARKQDINREIKNLCEKYGVNDVKKIVKEYKFE